MVLLNYNLVIIWLFLLKQKLLVLLYKDRSSKENKFNLSNWIIKKSIISIIYLSSDDARYINMLIALFQTKSFYFSEKYDLTTSL